MGQAKGGRGGSVFLMRVNYYYSRLLRSDWELLGCSEGLCSDERGGKKTTCVDTSTPKGERAC